MKIHPLPSSTPITPGHHILVVPQKCNCSDPVPQSPESRVSLMLSQWNTPTVLPRGVNSTFDVSTDVRCFSGMMHPWEQLVVLVRLRSRSSIIAPPSVVGRSMLSSEKLFTELLPFHTLVVLCCRLYWLCRLVKTMCKGMYASVRPNRHTYGNYRYTVANVDSSDSK